MTITFSIFRLCRLLFLYAAFSPFFFVQAQHKKKNLFYDREKTKLQAVYYVLGNNQNVIDSIYEEYYDNGQLRSRGNYRMNKPIGLWEYFHENGALRMKGEIQDFLQKCPFESVSVFQPSLLLGNRAEFRLGEKIGSFFMKLFSFLLIGNLRQYKPIQSEAVAIAMFIIAQKDNKGFYAIESDSIQEIANKKS